ncbi:MAG: hypothetical protein BGN99_25590 [Alphaproteobacteria bacterium 65-37]|jgi:uncharacterized membrane protein|uniref:DUF2189 domain-containing protein n=1 Tax=Reyranella sp. TaxID=1929291 RepID=UPI00095ED106|nr:DUF2189 domain-containing protein [Reyranella sp.]MBN9535287.1 DUF2189 domain-containing protein [Alphaproteobacteria bacterium]OJU36050.1 MAG: hypothetical protein BGN99_25590 [Alphaproteobacteria bacterium 65-37]
MATQNHIRNPLEWGWDHIKQTGQAFESAAHTMEGTWEDRAAGPPTVRKITATDIRDALSAGWRDFGAARTDVVFLCLLYPLAGLVISRMAFDYGMIALVFPLIAGFALIAPLFGVGLYEISRRREQGLEVRWTDAFAVVRSPAIGSIMVMGLLLLAIFCVWLFAANFLYTVTLGPDAPVSTVAFARDALTTPEGWTMTVVGIGVGFLFALAVLVIGVVSFPLLLDRNVGVGTAIATSVRAVRANPGPMLLWGLIVAAGLVVGTIPLLVGLAIILPVLGHATWHLYRKVVV